MGRPERSLEDILAHYGVKGMKWGVRKSETPKGRPSSRKITKEDKKWAKNIGSRKTHAQVYNKAVDHMNRVEVDRINNSPKYKGKDLTQDSKLREQYFKDFEKAFEKEFRRLAEELGSSPSGIMKASGRISIVDGFPELVVTVPKGFEHADGDFSSRIEVNESGHFTKFHELAEIMQDGFDDILEHFGVKGMKWGVRRTPAQLDSASDDAQRANTTRAQIQKNKGDVSSVSNKDLEHLVNRMNLEKRYSQMLEESRSLAKGQKEAKQFLETARTLKDLNKLLGNPAGKAAAKALAKILAGR